MNTVQFAQPFTNGALATSIGWFDYGNDLQLSNASPTVNVVNQLPNGYRFCFKLEFSASGFSAEMMDVIYTSAPTPTSPYAPLGNVDYTGIGGNPVLIGTGVSGSLPITVNITLSDFCLIDCNGCQVQNYLLVAADASFTNQSLPLQPALWNLTSNNSNWNQLQPIPAVNGNQEGGPLVQGIGTPSIQLVGLPTEPIATMSHVFITKNPGVVTASATSNTANAGFAFGIIVLSELCQPIKYVDACTINYVQADSRWTQPICIPEGYTLTNVIYQNSPFTAGFGPIVVEGWLGVYVVLENEIFIATYNDLIAQTYDFIIIIVSKGEDIIALPVLFEYKGN